MKLKQEQNQRVEQIIQSCKDFGLTDDRKVAYVLATIYHETWYTFRPIKEKGEGRGRKYGQKLDTTVCITLANIFTTAEASRKTHG